MIDVSLLFQSTFLMLILSTLPISQPTLSLQSLQQLIAQSGIWPISCTCLNIQDGAKKCDIPQEKETTTPANVPGANSKLQNPHLKRIECMKLCMALADCLSFVVVASRWNSQKISCKYFSVSKRYPANSIDEYFSEYVCGQAAYGVVEEVVQSYYEKPVCSSGRPMPCGLHGVCMPRTQVCVCNVGYTTLDCSRVSCEPLLILNGQVHDSSPKSLQYNSVLKFEEKFHIRCGLFHKLDGYTELEATCAETGFYDISTSDGLLQAGVLTVHCKIALLDMMLLSSGILIAVIIIIVGVACCCSRCCRSKQQVDGSDQPSKSHVSLAPATEKDNDKTRRSKERPGSYSTIDPSKRPSIRRQNYMNSIVFSNAISRKPTFGSQNPMVILIERDSQGKLKIPQNQRLSVVPQAPGIQSLRYQLVQGLATSSRMNYTPGGASIASDEWVKRDVKASDQPMRKRRRRSTLEKRSPAPDLYFDAPPDVTMTVAEMRKRRQSMVLPGHSGFTPDTNGFDTNLHISRTAPSTAADTETIIISPPWSKNPSSEQPLFQPASPDQTLLKYNLLNSLPHTPEMRDERKPGSAGGSLASRTRLEKHSSDSVNIRRAIKNRLNVRRQTLRLQNRLL